MPNRLADSLSPYLLQHAHNPVDWQPWDAAALASARAEQKPIFLSIGYSACHWCHVMERESFENPDVAEVLNTNFISIKVDREERPDLDDLYMDAVQALTGRGGWPMSVWLTPDLEPFFGGTYFPPEPRGGMPGFRGLLLKIAEAWTRDRGEVVGQAQALTAELRRQVAVEAGAGRPDTVVLTAALEQLRRGFDSDWGGFGPAPKFPQPFAVELILTRGTREEWPLALRTLDAMWEGGMYDHLGGGFSRYSVDDRWLVPHFEKMLYDNVQLAACYLTAFQATREPRYAQVAQETLAYLLRDLKDSSGGFHSSEDADSEGVEGKFYAFTPGEVQEALGAVDGDRFCRAFGITEAGTFEHGRSVIHRFAATAADRLAESEDRALRARLRLWREQRVRPGKDDKVLAAWNGLALSALARGAQVLGDPDLLAAAQVCASFLQRELWREGQLLRVWRRGRGHTPGFLEDYAAVVEGLVDLFETDFNPAWLRWAQELGEALLVRFQDREQGGFFSTEAGQTDLLFRQKPGFDNAIPSGNTLAARALLRLSRHLQREDFRVAAERTLQCFGPWMKRAPRAFLGMLGVLDLTLRDPLDVALSGDPLDEELQRMLREVHQRFLPGRVLSVSAHPLLPLGQAQGPLTGKPLAFVCRGRVCAAPVATASELAVLLEADPASM